MQKTLNIGEKITQSICICQDSSSSSAVQWESRGLHTHIIVIGGTHQVQMSSCLKLSFLSRLVYFSFNSLSWNNVKMISIKREPFTEKCAGFK